MLVVSTKKHYVEERNRFDGFRTSSYLDIETILTERGYIFEKVIHETEIVLTFTDTKNVFDSFLRFESTGSKLLIQYLCGYGDI